MAGKNKGSITSGMVARYTLVVLATLISTLFLWIIKDALLLAFAGIILAVILTGFARIVRRYTPLSRAWSLITVGLILLSLMGAFGFIFGSQVVDEFHELTEKLPEQVSELNETIREWPLGEKLLGVDFETGEENGDSDENDHSNLAEQAGGMLFQFGITLLDVLSTLALILFIGIFFAADPDVYKKAITLLFTKAKSDRINEAMETSGNALWQWLTGQFIAMTFVGITITIGLLIIGVPLALILGVIAGLSDFVPIIGPLVSVIPALLLAFSEGPQTALYTALLFLAVQQIESNLLTPLIQEKMVSIPPAVVLLSVVAFGLVFGIAGIVLATPLAVVAMVFIGMFYVQDVLGKEISIPGQK
jgi:predicted PurR-regulated permease PerM